MKSRHLLTAASIAAVMAASLAPAQASAPAKSSAAAFGHGEAKPNKFWWPNQLNLAPLRAHGSESNPFGESFEYVDAFNKLDLSAVKKDINELLTTSQDWWPSDYGNYGPLFIRMAWHSAGTYRALDGRGGTGGGQQRFDPLNSWPDNANLDKARRLLWPVKQKYGASISWADLMVLTGNVAMENMGFPPLGFAGGRTDDWEPDLVYWGPEVAFEADSRHGKGRKLEKPLAATQMGLIYVNPVGPNGKPDPLLAANDIRVTFAHMGMNDEETVALIAGGHTFGKAHGAHKHNDCVGAEPGGAAIEQQGLGWKNKCGKGHSEDTFTSGLEGAWTSAPARWTHLYLTNLFSFEWEQTTSPHGAIQWVPTADYAKNLVPDAHIPGKFHAPIMMTTDLSMKEDPAYRAVSERFLKDPKAFEQAFARAWFKLTHRDMGPRARYLGSEIPEQAFAWQDPVPNVEYAVIGDSDVATLKKQILDSGLSVPQLVRTAWASAASFRGSDMRGGANGARVALAPQNSWPVNSPDELSNVLDTLRTIQTSFNEKSATAKVSLADVIVLAGASAIEKAASDAGNPVTVPFKAGRTDASQAQTNVASFDLLELQADGFRNYFNAAENRRSPTDMLVDKANLLGLSVPEATVLVGGMRALNANANGIQHGVFTSRPGTLTNDFFVNLLSMSNRWQKTDVDGVYEGVDRSTGEKKYTATPVDLVFGSNSELRAIAEVYAFNDSKQKFVDDFVSAWVKVMQLDRFDLKSSP